MCASCNRSLLLAITLCIAAIAPLVARAQDCYDAAASGTGVRLVRSGAELAAAFADESVSLVIVERQDPQDVLTLAEGDFQGIAVPVRLTRNLTIRGSAAPRALWPHLRLLAKLKVQLLDSVTLCWTHVILEKFRSDNFLRAPGFDLLASSPPGTASAFLVGDEMAAILDVCYPKDLSTMNYAAVPRNPDVPGVQSYAPKGEQPGCVNDTAAPLLEQCWASKGQFHDFQMVGADTDSAGKPQPNGYGVSLLEMVTLCTLELSNECIQEFGPIGCTLISLRNKSSVPPPWSEQQQRPPPSPAGGAAGGASEPDAGHGRAGIPAGAIVGSVLGGVLLVGVVGVLALWKRRQATAAAHLLAEAAASKEWPDATPTSPTCEVHGIVSLQMCSTEHGTSKTRGPQSAVGPAEAALVTSQTPISPGVATCVLTASNNVYEVAPLDDETAGIGKRPGDAGAAAGSSAAHSSADVPAADVVKLLPVLLGKGAFGRVYEGTYRGQRVAVKQVLDMVFDDQDTQGQSQSSFAQELDVLGRCEHPNILRILAACLSPPRPCLVMELMDTSLDKLLYGKPEVLPMPLVLHIAIAIACGLEYLHPTILHRDLKPGNVLINDPWGERPVVKLSDFGLSRLRNTALVTDSPEAGTPAYVAPECYDLKNERITHQADIYAFGVVLWEMLAGSRPWEGIGVVSIACQVTLMGRRLPVPPPPDAPGSCSSRWPSQLCQLLDECWDKDPKRRPAAAELAKRLMLVQQVAGHWSGSARG